MSLCPSNDLHSVYLDNELPQEFVAGYEDHINNCPECKAKLEKLKAVRGMFTVDSKEITPDEHFLDESFDRLTIKMSYAKNVRQPRKEFSVKSFSYVAMAAAAVIAFAFIVPVRMNSVKGAAPETTVASIPYASGANNVSLNSGRSVVISGNIDGAVLPQRFDPEHRHHHHDGRFYENDFMQERKSDLITNVEMLRPNFEDSATFSIKITIPGVGSGLISADMPLPEGVITGTGE